MILQKQYADFVESRFKKMPNYVQTLLHAGVGIAGEGGEFLDSLKKSWVYNKNIDNENLIEELGDLMFYIQAAANALGVSLEDIVLKNIEKLMKRYPDGYSDAAAIARADKQ